MFGRTYAAEPDVLVEQLAEDTAIAAADTLLLTVPNQLGVEYNAHVIECILTHVAPRSAGADPMARFQKKRIDQPDEVRPFPLGSTEIFEMDDFVVGRMYMEPGWRWTKDVRPIAGTERCMYHHLGYCLSGTLAVDYEDGTTGTVHAGDMFEMPPGHDAWVEGDEPWVAIDFAALRSYARRSPPGPIASWRRCSSPISSTPPNICGRSATLPGETWWASTTR